MNATQTRTDPPAAIPFFRIDVESESGHDAPAHDSRLLTLERPHLLARVRRRTPRHSAPATRSSASISWATATAPPRMCL
jgi:hypothetical protein